MKRELASLDIYAVVAELQTLVDGYIDKIHQPAQNELVLKIKQKNSKEKKTLFIRNEELICLTDKRITALQKPPTFSMTLRKYISNGRIKAILQHECDRIIFIKIQKHDGIYTLVCELFSKGNIILLDPSGVIIYPLKIQHWAHRSIKPHQPYTAPPSQINPFNVSYQEFTTQVTKSTSDIVRTLAATLNLGGIYAEELCVRADLNKHTPIKKLTKHQLKTLYNTLTAFLSPFKENNLQPVYVVEDDVKKDVYPLILQKIPSDMIQKTTSFTAGLALFIQQQAEKKPQEDVYEQQLGKLKRQLQQQQRSISQFTQQIEQKKHEGDVLYLNFQQIQQLLDEIHTVLKEKDKQESIDRVNNNPIVKTFDPEGNTLVIQVQDSEGSLFDIPVDFRKNIAENAERAYEASKKYAEKLEGAKAASKQTQQQMTAVQRKKPTTEHEKTGKTSRTDKQFWFERFRWFISSQGNVVVAGRDAKTNEVVVKKYLEKGDRYVHADVQGAASCVVKTADITGTSIEISRDTLDEACIFAGCHSKAWKQFGEVQVYWVRPEQVSKTPQTGEFVPKGAFIIRGKRNYHQVKLVFAVGVITIEDASKVMGGPVSAVKKKADRYVIIEPGAEKKNVVTHTIAKAFGVSVDSVLQVLPPGDMQIVETVGCTL